MSYRPNAVWWGMGMLALALGCLGLDELLGWGLLGSPHRDGGGLARLAIGILFFVLLLAGWRIYRVTGQGLEVRGLVGRSFTSWAALDGVGTRALRRKMNMDRVGGASPITDPQAFVHDVWLKNGRVFTRIGPWIGHRRELVREIRRHVRESRDAPGRVSGA